MSITDEDLSLIGRQARYQCHTQGSAEIPDHMVTSTPGMSDSDRKELYAMCVAFIKAHNAYNQSFKLSDLGRCNTIAREIGCLTDGLG